MSKKMGKMEEEFLNKLRKEVREEERKKELESKPIPPLGQRTATSPVFLRAMPIEDSDIIDIIKKGNIVMVLEEKADWFKIGHGYAKKEFFQ